MNAYEQIGPPHEKAEARDLALYAGQLVTWAGQTTMKFDEALPIAWEHFGKAADFILAAAPKPSLPPLEIVP